MPNCFVKRYSINTRLLFKKYCLSPYRLKYCEILLVESCFAVSSFSLRLWAVAVEDHGVNYKINRLHGCRFEQFLPFMTTVSITVMLNFRYCKETLLMVDLTPLQQHSKQIRSRGNGVIFQLFLHVYSDLLA